MSSFIVAPRRKKRRTTYEVEGLGWLVLLMLGIGFAFGLVVGAHLYVAH